MMTDVTRSAYKSVGAGSEAKRIWSAGIPARPLSALVAPARSIAAYLVRGHPCPERRAVKVSARPSEARGVDSE